MIVGALKEVGINLRNLLHTRRIKSAKIVNPVVLLGLSGQGWREDSEKSDIWGRDPVHPLSSAYLTMAKALLDEVNVTAVQNVRLLTSPLAATPVVRQNARERWTKEAPTVASRTGRWAHGGGAFGGGDGGGGYKRGGPRGRYGDRRGRRGYGRKPY